MSPEPAAAKATTRISDPLLEKKICFCKRKMHNDCPWNSNHCTHIIISILLVLIYYHHINYSHHQKRFEYIYIYIYITKIKKNKKENQFIIPMDFSITRPKTTEIASVELLLTRRCLVHISVSFLCRQSQASIMYQHKTLTKPPIRRKKSAAGVVFWNWNRWRKAGLV